MRHMDAFGGAFERRAIDLPAGHDACTVDLGRRALMGEKVVATRAELSDRQLYRRKLQSCLDVLERMLREGRFDRPKAMMGLEIELNLADEQGQPLMSNEQVLGS